MEDVEGSPLRNEGEIGRAVDRAIENRKELSRAKLEGLPLPEWLLNLEFLLKEVAEQKKRRSPRPLENVTPLGTKI